MSAPKATPERIARRRDFILAWWEPGPGGCWLWKGELSRGYARAWLDGRKVRVHRIALENRLGRLIAPGLQAMHSCDVRRCINPAHLLEGSNADNLRDAARKGRMARGDRNGSRLYPERLFRGDQHSAIMRRVAARGENNGRAKLTVDQVMQVFAASGTQREIASRYGVGQTTVRKIRDGKTWKHITARPR